MEGSPSPASRSPSPAPSESSADAHAVACEWTGCTRSFADIPGLVEHLDSEHISANRPSYTCEWASCGRRGLVQASRFALVSHCRSHTGERPFVCASADCDKSFTRSDTLAKHMRQKHNLSPPAAARGAHRKRRRSPTPPYVRQPFEFAPAPAPAAPPAPDRDRDVPSHYNFANRTYAQHHDARDSGFNTFRVNPAPSAPAPAPAPTSPEEGPAPTHGRSRAMVQYLIMKAKYRYVMAEQGLLSDELDALKRQERDEWREKEAGVDRVLRVFGPQSEQLIHEAAHANGTLSPPDDP